MVIYRVNAYSLIILVAYGDFLAMQDVTIFFNVKNTKNDKNKSIGRETDFSIFV